MLPASAAPGHVAAQNSVRQIESLGRVPEGRLLPVHRDTAAAELRVVVDDLCIHDVERNAAVATDATALCPRDVLVNQAVHDDDHRCGVRYDMVEANAPAVSRAAPRRVGSTVSVQSAVTDLAPRHLEQDPMLPAARNREAVNRGEFVTRTHGRHHSQAVQLHLILGGQSLRMESLPHQGVTLARVVVVLIAAQHRDVGNPVALVSLRFAPCEPAVEMEVVLEVERTLFAQRTVRRGQYRA